jgi:hypothetical protein
VAAGTRKRANSAAKNVGGQMNVLNTDTRTNIITIGEAVVMAIIIGANTRTSIVLSTTAIVGVNIIGVALRASVMGRRSVNGSLPIASIGF